MKPWVVIRPRRTISFRLDRRVPPILSILALLTFSAILMKLGMASTLFRR